MAVGYILYNPKAGDGSIDDYVGALQLALEGSLQVVDITRITNYNVFLGGLDPTDYLVLAGGDGTLHRFVNDTAGIDIRQEILYYPQGTGNDFALEMGFRQGDMPFDVGSQLRKLPTVEIGGRCVRFLNAVGYGIDGYCCEEGDRRRKPGHRVNYTAIAVRGLLGGYRPTRAKVTVDGTAYTYYRVWLAPTMYGKYYGGGMMPVPSRVRDGETISVMVLHDLGRLRTLLLFHGIFTGKHVKHKKKVAIFTGQEITVEFDRPVPLQIDGETVTGVTRYTARAAARGPCGQGA